MKPRAMRQAARSAGAICLLLGGAMTVKSADAPPVSPCPRIFDAGGLASSNREPSDEAVRAWIDKTGFEGVLLGDGVRSGADDLRLRGWYVRSLREDLTTRFRQEATLVAADLWNGRVFFGAAFPRAKQPVRDAPPAGYDPGTGVVVTRFDVSPSEAVGRALPPGQYAFAVLYRGARSRTANGTVTEAKGSRTEGVASPKTSNVDWRVTLAPTAKAPAPPEEIGVVLRREASRDALLGSYRLRGAGGEHMLVLTLDAGRTSFKVFELPRGDEPAEVAERLGSFRVDLSTAPPSPGTWLHAIGPCADVASAVWPPN